MIIDLPTKRNLSDSRVTNIYKSFTHKMAAKTSWHRYGTKLRHCHSMYTSALLATALSVRFPGLFTDTHYRKLSLLVIVTVFTSRLKSRAFQFAIRIDSIRYANRFESIRFVKNRPFDSLVVMQLFLLI